MNTDSSASGEREDAFAMYGVGVARNTGKNQFFRLQIRNTWIPSPCAALFAETRAAAAAISRNSAIQGTNVAWLVHNTTALGDGLLEGDKETWCWAFRAGRLPSGPSRVGLIIPVCVFLSS